MGVEFQLSISNTIFKTSFYSFLVRLMV